MVKSSTQNMLLQQRFDWITFLGVTTAILSALAAASAGFGHRLNGWHFSLGFTILHWATIGALASIVLSLWGAFRTRPRKERKGFWQALLGLGIGLTVVAIPLYWLWMASSVPPIHDITTDTQNPPVFSALLPLRADAPNSSHYGGPPIAAQQQKAYPDIKPLHVPLEPKQALDKAVAIAQSLGWKVIEVTEHKDGTRTIEATDTTFWFGFVDDIIIRITPLDKGVKVDVRSVSRVGRSDVGTNAQRVEAFLGTLRRQVKRVSNQPPSETRDGSAAKE